MNLIECIRDAGVVGAGGAGFPTHVKVNCRAEYVIANGAECEPLLRVDQQLMERYPQRLVAGLLAVKEQVGASHAVIGLKAHYHGAVEALTKAIQGTGIRLLTMESHYPAGDEQVLVYEATKRVVPTGGLPLDVGAVVVNANTLINIADAIDGVPVTHRFVTVAGEVEKPQTLKVPIGTPIAQLLKKAGAPADMQEYVVILGGPCMGAIETNLQTPVTKTLGGILVFSKNHPLIRQKTNHPQQELKLAKAVCCQCNFCTQLCPRNALGLRVEPHKAMRAAANQNLQLLGDYNGIFSCCNCGICTYYACNFGLTPSRMMQRMKQQLQEAGIKPKKQVAAEVDSAIEHKKLPVQRLMARMGILDYDRPAPLNPTALKATRVSIPLKMHIGASAAPVVIAGQQVEAGQVIGEIPPGALGAKVHASISGTVIACTEQFVEIKA